MHVSLVYLLFRADSGTNLIKQRENVNLRSNIGSSIQSSHGKREALGLGPGRATIFSLIIRTDSLIFLVYRRRRKSFKTLVQKLLLSKGRYKLPAAEENVLRKMNKYLNSE